MWQGVRPTRTEADRCPAISTRRVAVVLALAVGMLATLFAQPASARKRPNLDVIHAEGSSSPRYVFPGVSARFSFEDVTKNKGDAPARRSVTAYFLNPEFGGRHSYEVASRKIPRLSPGDSDRGHASESIDTAELPLGTYELQACADATDRVRESREHNCQSTGKEFYVVKDDWTGSASGVGGVGSAAKAERWHSSGVAHLGFDKYLGDGVFRYAFSGVVQWTDNGINTIGCHLSGSGTQPVDEDNSGPGIKLKYGDGIYQGTESVYKRFYKIYFTGINMFGEDCTQAVDGPANPDFLQIHRESLLFDQDELKGSSPGDTPGGIWRWDFQ
jgi:CARDB